MRKLALVTALLLLPASAGAKERVVFEDGRSLEVDSCELRREVAVLRLEGGGELVMPAWRIVASEPARPPSSPEDLRPPDSPPVPEPLWKSVAGPFGDLIEAVAEENGLDGALLAAMVHVESNFDPYAVSPKGACGLLQLLPETAREFGVRDLFDPRQNLEGGARYLLWLLGRFDGRTELALAGFNAGAQAVDRHRGIPPYSETADYVTRVLSRAGLAPARSPGGFPAVTAGPGRSPRDPDPEVRPGTAPSGRGAPRPSR